MYVRVAIERDFEPLFEICAAVIPQVYPGDVAHRPYLAAAFSRYMTELDPMIFVCVERDDIVGFLAAQLCAFTHKPGMYTHQRAFCVRPEYRGTRGAALLMREFIAWSLRVGASQIHGGTSVGFKSKQLDAFLRRHGFEICGFVAKRELARGRRYGGQGSADCAAGRG